MISRALARARPVERAAIFLLTVLLAGYAFLGRGFAALGIPPLFIGELVLGIGLLAILRSGNVHRVFRSTTSKLVAFFIALGAVRLAFDLPTWGVMAARDAVVWGYALFALVILGLLTKDPERLRVAISRYRSFALGFVATAGVIYMAARGLGQSLPDVPFTGRPLVEAKPGDMLVHLAGATAFILVGLGRRYWWLWPVLGANVAIAAIATRGGMLAYLLATALVLIFKSKRVKLAATTYGAILLVTAFVLVNPRFELKSGREISVEQFADNFRSLFGGAEMSALDTTKKWRLDWWTKIVEYTFAGPYFFTGKGFGINLATDDGFQVLRADLLRSPHNGHLTILARMGVPGFLLWMSLLTAWYASMLRGLLESRRRKEDAWAGIYLFLLAYLTAFLVNAAFDVYLEGPMGGIWFWCVFGIGMAVRDIHLRFEPRVRRGGARPSRIPDLRPPVAPVASLPHPSAPTP